MPRLPFTPDDALWRFDTARLSVTFHATPDDSDPADHFENPADVEAIRNAQCDWFTAWVVVWDAEGVPLAWDTLGGCAYVHVSDFFTGHRSYKARDYFGDMIREACAAARAALHRYRLIPLRASAPGIPT